METIVLIMMMLATFNFAMKLSLMKKWQMLVFACLGGVFVGLMWPYAIEQSRSQIDKWLGDQALMQDTAVVVTFEVAWQTAYCVLAAYMMFADRLTAKTILIYRVLRFMPGVLILWVLTSLLVWAELTFVGADFRVTAWALGVAVMALLAGMATTIRNILPEKDIRLELLFMGNALVMTLGIIATVNGTTTFHGSDDVEWDALLACMATGVGLGLIGYARTLVKRRNSNIQH